MIVSAGSYRMTATVLLLGGATLVATSSVIVVPTNTSLRTLSLACTPALLLRGSTPGVISCTITATTNSTASVFAISPSSGNTSSVQQSYAGGLPMYSFTVDVSMTNYSLHFVIIAAASADSRYPGRIVDNSPAIVRIASVPDNSSLLVCTSNVTFNSIRYVRAVGAVSCALQGRVVVGSLTYDIIAPSSYFSVTASVDGVGTAVSLPSLPQGLNVAYTFTASPATAGSLFTIAANIAATAQSVVGSPSTFVILRTPSTSTLACHTTGIAIYDYFLPGEGITCTIILQDTNGVTQTPTYDLQPIIDSGSVQSISGSSLITNATFTATAPVGLGAVVLSTRYFAALATPQDQTFNVRVVYIPNNQTIASSSGTIVLATRVLGGENLVAGQQATLLISGSGLVLTHTYTISPFPSCNNTGSIVPGVTARGSTVAGDLALTFTTPSYPFYVCFQRSTLDSAHPLVQGVFHNITVAAAGGGLTNDDIILIVVACVLFCILLLLLPCVLWKLRSKPGPDPVFMYAPRVNDQYIHRPVTSSVVVSQTPAASTPRGSINNVPPPPGGMRDDFSFAPTIVPQDETESIKDEQKKKKKKIDASVKKIATMQQNELDARRSVQSSEHGGESPTMPPPNAGAPLQSTSNFLQPAHVITVEERHTHTYTSGPTGLPVVRPVTYEESVFVPPYDAGVQQEQGVHPQTATARPFSVFGHTSQQFATEN